MTERFRSPVAPPEGARREIAVILMEEIAEVQDEALMMLCLRGVAAAKRASKLLRFGIAEVQHGQEMTNGERLGYEIGDLLETVDFLIHLGVVTEASIAAGRANKTRQLSRYMQSEIPPNRG